MQGKNSHNRQVVSCYTSKFSSFGTCWNCCASEGWHILSLPGAWLPHTSSCLQPGHTSMPDTLLTRREAHPQHIAWHLSLTPCSTWASLPLGAVMLCVTCSESRWPVTLWPSVLGMARNSHRATWLLGQDGRGMQCPPDLLPPPVHGQPNTASSTA